MLIIYDLKMHFQKQKNIKNNNKNSPYELHFITPLKHYIKPLKIYIYI